MACQQHLASEEIAQRTGAKFTHVAYRGGGTAMNDLIAARLDFGGFLAGTTKPLVASGQLKGIAIVAEKRSELVPDIPPRRNRACQGSNSSGVHFMLFAPAATPKPIVAMLGVELKKIIAEPKLKERFAGIGFDRDPDDRGGDHSRDAPDRDEACAGDQASQYQAGLIAGVGMMPAKISVIPALQYRDAKAAIDFLCKAFGYREERRL